ncbi:hypothetical protein M8J77_018781 [Diaphorina citri]|nr:hypothetical protein M8J77_018781 [Diaphorina citri]
MSKTNRSALRRSVDKACKRIKDLAGEEPLNQDAIIGQLELLKLRFEELSTKDHEVMEQLLDQKAKDKEIDAEQERVDHYASLYFEATSVVTTVIQRKDRVCDSETVSTTSSAKHKYKLPSLKLKEYDGTIGDFLPFWSQFERIHSDQEMANVDKLGYLRMVMVPGTPAAKLVESYPATGDMYPKVVHALKERFGRKDLLTEFFIRELLKLVIQNASRQNLPLATLYDKIQSHMRNLETLDVTSENCASILLPLISSGLPPDLLQLWERSNHKSESKECLADLMEFLRGEVESTQKLELANSSFITPENATYTSSDLMNGSGKVTSNNKGKKPPRDITTCIFCEKQGHSSKDCRKGLGMILSQRKDLCNKKGACYSCLTPGHRSSHCRKRPKCGTCGRAHYEILCEGKEAPSQESPSGISTTTVEDLASSTKLCNVLMYTLVVNIHSENDSIKRVRVIIDTGSQRSYVLNSTVSDLKLVSHKKECIVHVLFGGSTTKPVDHDVYKIHLSSLDGSYRCNFDVLGQDQICGNIPVVPDGPWMKELQDDNIFISDSHSCQEDISVLIGADVAAKLWTGRTKQTSSGLVALQTKLGWTLSDNYNLSLKRLESTVRRLKREGYEKEYGKVLDGWKESGIIELVPPDERDNSAHYVPHHHVVKPNSTTPVRPVFDCSAKDGKKASLNECLESGPNLLEKIPAVLAKFRQEKFGISGDIAKAFLQISITPRDRDFLRFLWRTEDGELQVLRHCRVVFGATPSPFLLEACIRLHIDTLISRCEEGNSTHNPELLVTLRDSFYVDNCLSSVSSLEQAERFISLASDVMASKGFDLRGWEKTGDGDKKLANVLGLLWNKEHDTLSINIDRLMAMKTEVVTKRVLLSAAHRLFDPIGIVSSVALIPKLLVQETWRQNLAWNAEVDEDTRTRFDQWLNEIPLLTNVCIPRWIRDQDCDNAENQVHVFTDACKTSYAACIYLRTKDSEGVTLRLLASKAKVAPVSKKGGKDITIPRLELLAASIGARLYQSVTQDYKLTEAEAYFWTDASTVIAWLKRNEPWDVYVMNRIREIKSLTQDAEWRHVPGSMNPADLPSRGSSVKKYLQLRWWEGPSWLKESPEYWPTSEAKFDEDEINQEKRKTVVSSMLNQPESSEWYNLSSYTKPEHCIKVGDIVLIGDDNVKRTDWPIARIVALVRGNDNHVRVVKLKTRSGILTRPIQRVYPLEISSNGDYCVSEDVGTDESDRTNNGTSEVDVILRDTHQIKQTDYGQPTLEQVGQIVKVDSKQPSPIKANITRVGRNVKKPIKLDL